MAAIPSSSTPVKELSSFHPQEYQSASSTKTPPVILETLSESILVETPVFIENLVELTFKVSNVST